MPEPDDQFSVSNKPRLPRLPGQRSVYGCCGAATASELADTEQVGDEPPRPVDRPPRRPRCLE